jgi:DNA-binding Lrp family transcriptional regulator
LQLAELVGLSASPCLRRVKILEKNGVIDRYVALVNQAAVNLKTTFFVRVTMARNDQATMDNFASEVRAMREVMECHLLSGGCDFLLRIAAEDIDSYQRFQAQHLTKISGILNIETQISLKQITRTTELPF